MSLIPNVFLYLRWPTFLYFIKHFRLKIIFWPYFFFHRDIEVPDFLQSQISCLSAIIIRVYEVKSKCEDANKLAVTTVGNTLKRYQIIDNTAFSEQLSPQLHNRDKETEHVSEGRNGNWKILHLRFLQMTPRETMEKSRGSELTPNRSSGISFKKCIYIYLHKQGDI